MLQSSAVDVLYACARRSVASLGIPVTFSHRPPIALSPPPPRGQGWARHNQIRQAERQLSENSLQLQNRKAVRWKVVSLPSEGATSIVLSIDICKYLKCLSVYDALCHAGIHYPVTRKTLPVHPHATLLLMPTDIAAAPTANIATLAKMTRSLWDSAPVRSEIVTRTFRGTRKTAENWKIQSGEVVSMRNS